MVDVMPTLEHFGLDTAASNRSYNKKLMIVQMMID